MKQRQVKPNVFWKTTQKLTLLCVIVLLWSCGPTTTSDSDSPEEMPATQTSGTPSGAGSATTSGALPTDSQVTISVDARPLPQERLQVFEEQGGAESLFRGISAEIADKGKQFGAEPTEIQVTVTRFRLRSTAAGFWLGMMAGADILDVSVAVVTNGQTKKTFDTGVGGAVAGLIKPTAGGRFEGLVDVVSQRIVEGL